MAGSDLVDVGRLRDLLARLEAHWRAQGAPVARCLRPGLSDAEMDQKAARLGISLPVEVREWWRWHDGTALPPDLDNWPARDIGNAHIRLTFDEAIAEHASRRQTAKGVADVRPADETWNRHWLPITGREDPIAVDCGVAETAPAPIRRIDWTSHTFAQIRLTSLTALIEMWVFMFDDELRWYDPQKGWNHVDAMLVPEEYRETWCF